MQLQTLEATHESVTRNNMLNNIKSFNFVGNKRRPLGMTGGFRVPLQSPSQLNPSNHLNETTTPKGIEQYSV